MVDRDVFSTSMAFLQKLFGHTLDYDILNIYWSTLNTMDPKSFLTSVQGITTEFIPTSSLPFPVPAHFMKYSGQSTESKSKIAIQRVKWAIASVGKYDSVNFNDTTLHGVIERWGGWVTLCNWTAEDWQINQRRFEEDYEAATNAGFGGEDHLHGIFEAHNAAAGFPYEPPYLIGNDENGKLIKSQIAPTLLTKEPDNVPVLASFYASFR
jgi:hypothetical protein